MKHLIIGILLILSFNANASQYTEICKSGATLVSAIMPLINNGMSKAAIYDMARVDMPKETWPMGFYIVDKGFEMKGMEENVAGATFYVNCLKKKWNPMSEF